MRWLPTWYTNASATPLVSPFTRFDASETNAFRDGPFGIWPVYERESRLVVRIELVKPAALAPDGRTIAAATATAAATGIARLVVTVVCGRRRLNCRDLWGSKVRWGE